MIKTMFDKPILVDLGRGVALAGQPITQDNSSVPRTHRNRREARLPTTVQIRAIRQSPIHPPCLIRDDHSFAGIALCGAGGQAADRQSDYTHHAFVPAPLQQSPQSASEIQRQQLGRRRPRQ